MAGKAEKFTRPMLSDLLSRYGWWLKNNTDMTRFGLVEPGVDFALSLATIQIEVKNTDKDGVLADAPSKVQAEQLDRHDGFILLVMWDKGYPSLPAGGDGYLVPWEAYKQFMAATGVSGKSVRRRKTARSFGADELLAPYRLEWRRGSNGSEGHFVIPTDHPFWQFLLERVRRLVAQAKEIKSDLERLDGANQREALDPTAARSPRAKVGSQPRVSGG